MISTLCTAKCALCKVRLGTKTNPLVRYCPNSAHIEQSSHQYCADHLFLAFEDSLRFCVLCAQPSTGTGEFRCVDTRWLRAFFKASNDLRWAMLPAGGNYPDTVVSLAHLRCFPRDGTAKLKPRRFKGPVAFCDKAGFPEQLLRYETNGLSRDAAAELLCHFHPRAGPELQSSYVQNMKKLKADAEAEIEAFH